MSSAPEPLPPAAQRVQDALIALGRTYVVHQLDRSTRTAAEAAQAVGCQVGQIAKSLVFRGQSYRASGPGDRLWREPGERGPAGGPAGRTGGEGHPGIRP